MSQDDSPSLPSRMPTHPRLPPEVLEYTVSLLAPGAVAGDAVCQRTLVRLSGVSRVMRHWAFQALFTVLVLPRHVREFRKWYARMRSSQPPFPFAGYTRGVFCALDDISRLTTFSAGWDAELLRMLHYCGPTLTHLSLWRSESTALLRDPGQVRASHRLGKQQPAWSWGETGHIAFETDGDAAAPGTPPSAASNGGDEETGAGGGPTPLYTSTELAEMPNWLRAEIASQGSSAVTRQHKAHLVPTLPTAKAHNDCRPTHISLVLALPLYEHEDPALFAMMSLWSRVQQLDIYIPTPNQAARCLALVAALYRSPLERLRVGTCHASLVLRNREGARRWWNAARALAVLMEGVETKQMVTDELMGHHRDPQVVKGWLERRIRERGRPTPALNEVEVEAEGEGQGQGEAEGQEKEGITIKLAQRNQQHWGKLKDRLWDFQQRVAGNEGAWDLF
ncbi:hypothetical protein ACQY0O_007972 [Thecaphora frezii]